MSAFYLVGPTASGKSELAQEVAESCGAEVISADAFQVYREIPILTAQPDAVARARVPHHFIATQSVSEEWNVEKFRSAAAAIREEVRARGRLALVVGGSGLYVRALLSGLSRLPSADRALRAQLESLSREELFRRLERLDPETAGTIDRKNPRRLIRALEICLLTGRPVSETRLSPAKRSAAPGVLVFWERDDLRQRIDERVEQMFAGGVVKEVSQLQNVSGTAGQAIGLRPIREMLAGKISEAECIRLVQQETRRYAKRQLTWFRHQTNFESLNLSRHGWPEAIAWISQRAARVRVGE